MTSSKGRDRTERNVARRRVQKKASTLRTSKPQTLRQCLRGLQRLIAAPTHERLLEKLRDDRDFRRTVDDLVRVARP